MGESNQILDGIAIIGMAGRFPGAENVEQFWRNVRDGVESISSFTDEELKAAGVPEETLRSPQYVRAGAVLDDIDLFDASFFGFSPREAEIIDPQHRLFLECAWEALENACCDPEEFQGLIGVYAGVSLSRYLLNLYTNREVLAAVGRLQLMIGNDKDHLPTRTSYKLNLRGPSVSVQTSCSTSLMATYLACQSLLSYQCDVALAGGASVAVPQKSGYMYQEGGILSPDGHCRVFDADAQGTVGGSGIGVVVLKRLADALADGDSIRAVIRGAYANNDGSAKIGYTAPSIDGQAKVIAGAQAVAEVEPESITYIEAHGTGTTLGDPIEIAALTKVFRTGREQKASCAIGSIKSNVGHLDAAAGVTSLIKTTLALEHKQLPPSLNFEKPNPKIDFANSPFYVNTRLTEWRSGATPRRAGVSSFGIGGTNVHVVLEEAPEVDAASASRPRQLLILSAKTDTALETATGNLLAHLTQNPELNLADVAYSYQVGRKVFGHRRMLVCRDTAEAVSLLETNDPRRIFSAVEETTERHVMFMFPGQGTQHVQMARELYETEKTFRATVDDCTKILAGHLGFDLREAIYPEGATSETAQERLNQTSVTQPALFVVEYALAKLWMAWGVEPQAMIGHSIGEYVAACLAGVMTLEDALELVAVRGRLMQHAPDGTMLAVTLTEDEARRRIGAELSLAAVNAPSLCVVAGAADVVERLREELVAEGVICRPLQTSHAFHSASMDAAVEPFLAHLKKIELRPPQIPFVSNVTGQWITPQEATDPQYWATHLRHTVRFADCAGQLLAAPDAVLLEVGPGNSLSGLVKLHPAFDAGRVVLSSLPAPGKQQSDADCLLQTLGRLWLAGVGVKWAGFYTGERRRRLPLPTYPFERQSYWIEARAQKQEARANGSPLRKAADVADWFYTPIWKQSVPVAQATPEDAARCVATWLVLESDARLSAQLVERLRGDGAQVVSVKSGESFTRAGGDAYTINPQRPEDYNALLKELHDAGRAPQTILHLWCLTPEADAASESGALAETQARGFYSLLFLAQALGAQSAAANPTRTHIEVVLNNLHAISGDEDVKPEKATIAGPCQIIPQEYPHISCRLIDVASSPHGDASETRLLDQILTELAAPLTDALVAYRGARRWVRTFERVRLESQDLQSHLLRAGGTYLVTGGFGGIGSTLAQHLARTVKANLVLVGRTALPVKDAWAQWLETHDAQDETAGKIRLVQLLEELGAHVLPCCADVADRAQMRDVAQQIHERFGALHGIIHAAGIAGGGLIQLKKVAAAAAVLSPKVEGTLALAEVFEQAPLDFFVVCSSLTSILGGFGQVDYCSANAFLDAFAYRQTRANGTRTVSINWDAWREVGMAVNAALPQQLQAAHAENLQRAILPVEGIDVFTRALAGGLPQVIVSTIDLPSRIEQRKSPQNQIDVQQATQQPVDRPAHPRPALSNAYVAPRDETEKFIADIWQKNLGIEQVGIHDNFFELGGHSLLAIQLHTHLTKGFNIELKLNDIFEATTVAELALLVLQKQAEQTDTAALACLLAELEQLAPTAPVPQAIAN